MYHNNSTVTGTRERRHSLVPGTRRCSTSWMPSPLSRNAICCIVGTIVGALVGSFCHLNTRFSVTQHAPTTKQRISVSDTNNPTAPWPRIAWLMSFPNSGTTFTMDLVGNATLHYPASNYGEHNIDSDLGRVIPVLDSSPVGPFFVGTSDPSSKIRGVTYPVKGYVVTKTHCGFRCARCGPTMYMETPHQFQMRCLMTKKVWDDATNKPTLFDKSHYDPSLVHRAIHLVRNPFNNVVARFRFHQNNHPDSYTNDREGFQEFCHYMNNKYAMDEERSPLMEKSILDIIRHVPCHADFIRYVMWHNFAFTTTRNMQLPTLIIHYEDYECRFDETLAELLDFLEQDFIGRPIEFVAGKNYIEYYTDQDLADVKAALKELAYLETWQNIEHYFSLTLRQQK